MTTDRPEPVSDGPRDPSDKGSGAVAETRRTLVARSVALVLAGALLGGPAGAIIALIGVLATRRRSTGPTIVAALVLILAAAVATLVESPVTEAALSSDYAQDRPAASMCATAAGILLLVAVVTLLTRSRPEPFAAGDSGSAPPAEAGEPTSTTRDRPIPAAPLAGADATSMPHPDGSLLAAPLAGADATSMPDPDGARAATSIRLALVLGLVVGLVALVVFGLTAPSPPRATQEVAASVAMGTGWGLPVDGRIRIDGTQPPLPVVVTAVGPGGSRWWTALAGVVAMGLVGAVARRRTSEPTAVVAALVTGFALVAVRADLAGCLAAALMAAAVALGDPLDRTVGRAALAGAAFGGVCLCLPAAVFLLPVLVVALAVHPMTRELSLDDGLAGGAAAAIVVTPWLRWVHERFATWSPAASLELPLSTVTAAAVPALVVAAVGLWRRAFAERST